MKKLSKQTQRMEVIEGKPAVTMGLDMGDRFSPCHLPRCY
jgi:hypothetical protein